MMPWLLDLVVVDEIASAEEIEFVAGQPVVHLIFWSTVLVLQRVAATDNYAHETTICILKVVF